MRSIKGIGTLLIVLVAVTVLVSSAAYASKNAVTLAWQAERWELTRHLWEEKHPDIEVEIVGGVGVEQLLLQTASGVAPDVVIFAVETFLQAVENDLIQPLDSLIERDEELKGWLNGFHPTLMEGMSHQGQQYLLPFYWATELMWYNKQLIAEAGLIPPTDDWTMDEFLSMAKKLTRDDSGDGEIDQFGLADVTPRYFDTMPWVFSSGNTFLNEDLSESVADEPEFARALEFMQDAIWRHRIAPAPGHDFGWKGRDGFVGGRSAFMQYHGAALGDVFHPAGFDDFDAVYIPNWHNRETVLGFAGFGIATGSNNADEAFQVLKFIVSPEIQLYWQENRNKIDNPHREVINQHEWAPRIYGTLDHARPLPAPTKFTDVNHEYMGWLGQVLRNEISPQEAALQIYEGVQTILNE